MAFSNDDYIYDDDIIDESADDEIDEEVDISSYPNRTFKMNTAAKRFSGMIDEEDSESAIRQVVSCILNTQRYNDEAFSSDYGFEYQDLIGQDKDYVCAVLPSRIKEALIMDDRIEDVTDFDISVKKKNAYAKFTVVTADEDIEIETEVNINV